MKKLLIGLTLLASMSSFAGSGVEHQDKGCTGTLSNIMITAVECSDFSHQLMTLIENDFEVVSTESNFKKINGINYCMAEYRACYEF
jgi:hypothetical protein